MTVGVETRHRLAQKRKLEGSNGLTRDFFASFPQFHFAAVVGLSSLNLKRVQTTEWRRASSQYLI